ISGSGSSAGTYSFDLRDAAVPITPLTLGTPFTGTLANPFDQAVYTFTAAVGQQIVYDATVNTINILATLDGPDNERIFSQSAGGPAGPFVLTVAGNYTLTISGSGFSTGGFGFVLRQTPISVTPLTPGMPTSGTLANPGDQAVYTFAGTAGQRVAYDALFSG